MFRKALMATFLLLTQASPLAESKAESQCCAVQEDYSTDRDSVACRLQGGVDSMSATEMKFYCDDDNGNHGVIGEVTVKCLRRSCPGIDPYIHINTHEISSLMVWALCGGERVRLQGIWDSRTSMYCPKADYNAFGWPIEDCADEETFSIQRTLAPASGTC